MKDEQGNEVQPPPELRLAFQCRRWNTLPNAGGILDQPIRLMALIDEVIGVYDAMAFYASATKNGQVTQEWMMKHPFQTRVWSRIQIERTRLVLQENQ